MSNYYRVQFTTGFSSKLNLQYPQLAHCHDHLFLIKHIILSDINVLNTFIEIIIFIYNSIEIDTDILIYK